MFQLALSLLHFLPTARLTCIDPFEEKNGNTNPQYLMAKRLLRRQNDLYKVIFLLGYSTDIKVKSMIPEELDFIYIDGDHSYEVLQNDWQIALEKTQVGSIICLHDTTVPAPEPFRLFGSTNFYNEHIVNDTRFKHLETCYSMNVLKRII